MKPELVVGGMALIVIFYRVIFLMIPMFKQALAAGNLPAMFKSFTLLV
tara:strand:- start:238 stop:381 length:144 start_codon:yes stop_codon:yes gene_type:complete